MTKNNNKKVEVFIQVAVLIDVVGHGRSGHLGIMKKKHRLRALIKATVSPDSVWETGVQHGCA